VTTVKRNRYRWASVLAAGAASLALVIAAGAPAGAASATKSSQTFPSGAGPGWPKTLSPSDFVRRVDNPWFPLKPGSRWHYRGADDGGPFTDNMRVTHRTKRVEGVRVTIVHDVVRRHGKLREVTSDWYAQDRHRNVWYFGENTKELDRHGHVKSTEGSFKAGRDGARAGVLFPGHPRVGQKARQEYYKGHAADHFKVLDLATHVTTPFVTTDHALLTKEWSPLEPGVIDHKWYARGIGDVKEKTMKGGKEIVRLVRFHSG
jgi:hypothetical protein